MERNVSKEVQDGAASCRCRRMSEPRVNLTRHRSGAPIQERKNTFTRRAAKEERFIN